MGHQEGKRGSTRGSTDSQGDVKSWLQPSLLLRLPKHTVEDDSFDSRGLLSVLGTIWPQSLLYGNSRGNLYPKGVPGRKMPYEEAGPASSMNKCDFRNR